LKSYLNPFSSLEIFSTLFAPRFNLQFIRYLVGFELGSGACARGVFAIVLVSCLCLQGVLVSFNLEHFNICLFCFFQNMLSYRLKICGDVYHGHSYMQLFSSNFWTCFGVFFFLKYLSFFKIFFFFV